MDARNDEGQRVAGRRGHGHVVRRGEGEPLVLVHGNGVDHRLLLALDDTLDSCGWERIYLDLPGFGGTPPLSSGPGGLPEIAHWLEQTVAELLGEQPLALLGNSLGGLLVRWLAARHREQVRGIALLAPVVDPDVSARHVPEQTVVTCDEALLASLPEQDREEFSQIAACWTRPSWERFRDAALPGIKDADPVAMARLGQRYTLGAAPEHSGPPFEGPTLIVTGRQDHVVGFEDQHELLSAYPRASFAVLDAAGHNVHLEQPEIIAALLRDWSRRVQAG
ncbi:alpha/beta hydrolase [Arachnia propionica]|uniref:Alpha/beta hydrolase n=1 Tax=Arachnia propionica TaxID=1750 RepID=A0A3P1TB88_9ACTN|nr:alpha/beta hydrolase [Arachnia propionica]RRD06674.1 alpha/beta hydrolase [Arachnia propionica]